MVQDNDMLLYTAADCTLIAVTDYMMGGKTRVCSMVCARACVCVWVYIYTYIYIYTYMKQYK